MEESDLCSGWGESQCMAGTVTVDAVVVVVESVGRKGALKAVVREERWG